MIVDPWGWRERLMWLVIAAGVVACVAAMIV
jgi:hypothetical protein